MSIEPEQVPGASAFSPAAGGTLVAIGNFDGVHRGHAGVLAEAVSEARGRRLQAVLLTFHPHPRVVLGRAAPEALTPLERKLELLRRLQPELHVVVEPFTPQLAQFSAQQFAELILVEQLAAKVVVVGDNFRFGRGRAGDLAGLRTLGARLGFEAHAHELIGDELGEFSSTRIRRAVALGDVSAAWRLLGRPHALSGEVVPGDRRGRTLGTPTANLAPVEEATPALGVYSCLVDRLDPSPIALGVGVVNVGVRPTVGAGFSVEVHLLDFDADLYGARLRVHLLERLREERRFAGVEALKEQIELDVAAARLSAERLALVPGGDGAWF
ncbi:MAG: bifunctional riboflavin kinase/FAD synthetase [Polyangiaceae bacterium]|nr:bifunctional riboflavin kinase/FAD synthetase [Polyangiaceae bacterium]